MIPLFKIVIIIYAKIVGTHNLCQEENRQTFLSYNYSVMVLS